MSVAAASDGALPLAKPAAMPDSVKYLIFGVMAFGQFMAMLDIQIVAASLNDIRAGLSAAPALSLGLRGWMLQAGTAPGLQSSGRGFSLDAGLRSDWRINDENTLSFLTSYENFDINHAFLPQTGLNSRNTDREMVDHTTASEFELRLSGDPTETFHYLAGLYISHDRVNDFNRVYIDSNSAVYPLPLAGNVIAQLQPVLNLLGITGPLPTLGDLLTNRVSFAIDVLTGSSFDQPDCVGRVRLLPPLGRDLRPARLQPGLLDMNDEVGRRADRPDHVRQDRRVRRRGTGSARSDQCDSPCRKRCGRDRGRSDHETGAAADLRTPLQLFAERRANREAETLVAGLRFGQPLQVALELVSRHWDTSVVAVRESGAYGRAPFRARRRRLLRSRRSRGRRRSAAQAGVAAPL